MILAIVSVLVAVAGAQNQTETNAQFTAFLQQIPQHASFQRLSSEEQLLFGELVLAGETSAQELTDFIDRVGLGEVLSLMNHLSDTDAHTLTGYLTQHLNYDQHSSGWWFVNNWYNNRHHGDHNDRKRDSEPDEDYHWTSFYGLLHELQHQDYFEHLPGTERKTFDDMMEAVRRNHFEQWLDDTGYGPIFGLLNVMDPNHAHEVYIFIEESLKRMSGARTIPPTTIPHTMKPPMSTGQA